jgi:hypothetical protein
MADPLTRRSLHASQRLLVELSERSAALSRPPLMPIRGDRRSCRSTAVTVRCAAPRPSPVRAWSTFDQNDARAGTPGLGTHATGTSHTLSCYVTAVPRDKWRANGRLVPLMPIRGDCRSCRSAVVAVHADLWLYFAGMEARSLRLLALIVVSLVVAVAWRIGGGSWGGAALAGVGFFILLAATGHLRYRRVNDSR